MKSRFFCIFIFFGFTMSGNAQNLQDTLSFKDFLSIVNAYHPVSLQANLLKDLARAKRTKALGGFDPKIDASFEQKYFDGSNYYTFFTPQLKLPLWYGIELKGSYSTAKGNYLNPESKLPKEGLGYTGVSIQLGKGLLMDDRRAALKQAEVFTESSENGRSMILNDLYLEAGSQYLDWQTKYKILMVYNDALDLAERRYRATVFSFKNGDKPAIDTVEAILSVKQRQIASQEAALELRKSFLMLGDFLWLENRQGVDVNKLKIVPENTVLVPIDQRDVTDNNPKLLSYAFKLRDLGIERRLKAESLKPEINIQLGVLNKGKQSFNAINSMYWQDNNKVNIGFSFPLTLSKARGDLTETKIKIRETELEQLFIKNELRNKASQNSAEIATLIEQISLLNETYEISKKLVQGEDIKLSLGESSLFLVNSRASKLIEVEEKLLTTELKLKKAKMKSLWLSGILVESIDATIISRK